MSFEDGGYVFPKQDMLHSNGDMIYGYDGMTTRVYLAGQIIGGGQFIASDPGDRVREALGMADAIILQDRIDTKEDYEKRKADRNGN